MGVSGGVDSAVAALLLKEAGHAVEGLFMSNWEDDEDAYCTTASDWQDARRVCDTLKIPLHRASRRYRFRPSDHRSISARREKYMPTGARSPRSHRARVLGSTPSCRAKSF